jgi:hypothetical protein
VVGVVVIAVVVGVVSAITGARGVLSTGAGVGVGAGVGAGAGVDTGMLAVSFDIGMRVADALLPRPRDVRLTSPPDVLIALRRVDAPLRLAGGQFLMRVPVVLESGVPAVSEAAMARVESFIPLAVDLLAVLRHAALVLVSRDVAVFVVPLLVVVCAVAMLASMALIASTVLNVCVRVVQVGMGYLHTTSPSFSPAGSERERRADANGLQPTSSRLHDERRRGNATTKAMRMPPCRG